ncbi:tagatose-bisphosphate aldolase catalytic subunit [Halanaerobium congolense]|uniref:D-tagatose-bisphosphate aldolase class II n=1 Tax=Halanaerobium congolense TaxID=54121 RepID=A0A4R8GC07_9FIRM|nr:tagatose-bisphosphate aldolase catalytic subunit [Halanaerobium congolense]
MFIISNRNLLLDAQKRKYAVPAFNIHNLETTKVVVEAAEELNSPIILAATPGTIRFAGARYLVNIMKSAAAESTVPIAFHLDHHENIEDIKESIKLGCKSVMIDASALDYEDNIAKVKEVVEFARLYDVSVEAELGKLVGQEDDIEISDAESELTDPNLAADFVERTGIDSLAVAIGTAHGLYKKDPKIDYERLKAIENNVDIPLVLHGASGVPDQDVRKSIEMGITKVNIATELKIAFSDAVKEYFSKNPEANDPRKYLKPGKENMKKLVKQKIKLCGSENKGLLK